MDQAEEDQQGIEQEVGEETESPASEDEVEHDDSERSVASSMVASWAYDREGESIVVTFLNGHSQSYSCDSETWESAKQSTSPGRFMHENFL